ncbi:amidohydrolase [Phascolarctobacterium sp.]|uniref:amidohydrolase n=2 Tax=Phascolarctobacterium TaxID=33024 RepID=UPI0025D7B0BD|nr:amidohydrolase [uncultured Phascolarctobacterium sp.]
MMKAKVCAAIDACAEKIEALAQDIEREPELGFKETKTAAKVVAFLKDLGLEPQTGLAITGVKARAQSGRPGPTVAVLGELDAIGCPDSCKADPLTGAAHACGHNLQIATMAAAACGIMQSGVLSELSGDAVFFGVPAEEYVELAYRNKLIKEGKLHFLTGKGQLIYEGAFDDIDMAMQMHADKNMPEATISIGESSNGFIGKTIQYVGKTAHAADAPDQGINALNAAMLGLMGINALRETFREADVIRVHPIITKGGDLVNSVPADVRIETYVRAKTMEAIEATHTKVDAALKAGGDAVGAETVIATMPGQLPLACSATLNELFVANSKLAEPKVTVKNAGHFSASTDMGDVSHLLPVIHPFIGGVDGFLHTADFHVIDFKDAVLLPAKAFAMMIIDLLADDAQLARQVKAEHRPLLTKAEYIAKLDKYFQ